MIADIGLQFQPEDWDEEEDGEWTPPTMANPEYKGPWKAKVCRVCIISQTNCCALETAVL